MKMLHSLIEPLEARIAPATLVGNVLTYTDIGGAPGRVAFTHGTMAPEDFHFSSGTANDGVDTPRTLTSINVAEKPGIGFTLTAISHAGKGDSHANVGAIFANSTASLGSVKVDGDVG